jgi:hypothetical protein
MDLTTEQAKLLSEAEGPGAKVLDSSAALNPKIETLSFAPDEQGVILKWRPGRVHEIQVINMVKPSQLRQLLEFGLKHIRACLFRGKPITSEAQVSHQKREGDI